MTNVRNLVPDLYHVYLLVTNYILVVFGVTSIWYSIFTHFDKHELVYNLPITTLTKYMFLAQRQMTPENKVSLCVLVLAVRCPVMT